MRNQTSHLTENCPISLVFFSHQLFVYIIQNNIYLLFVIREREEKERLAREEKEREEEEYARHKAQLDAMEAKVIFFDFFP